MKRLHAFKKKILTELHKAFHEDHSDREIALSFSIGVFITSLPTLGTGLLLFFILARISKRISKLSLVASVVVLNPFVKPLFWIASINLGAIIFTRDLTLTTDPETALLYLIVGNLIIAFLASIIAYFFALKAVRRYREEGLEIEGEIDKVIEEKIEQD